MLYLFETNLIKQKSALNAITNVFGINLSTSIMICNKLGFSKNLKISDLSEEQIRLLLKLVENSNLKINSTLKFYKKSVINELISIKSYRGLRNLYKLPARGQRTHTNSKTSKRRYNVFMV